MHLQNDNSVWLKLLRPGFEYPLGVFQHRDALYYPSENTVFLVTKREASKYGEDVFTEISIWNPDEIQLLGTLALSVPEGHGFTAFAPWHTCPLPDLSLDDDLSSHQVIILCEETAFALMFNEENSPVKYSLRTMNRSNSKVEGDLFENIDLANGVLMRGLYTLIKSPLLMHGYDSMEEAFMNLQISREAALQLIREHIRSSNNPDPSYRDAHGYIRSNFHMGEPLVDYLEMQHELWVETKHPLSVYGAEWAPSLSAEDVYETYECLISIYRHIVLGEPGGSSAIGISELAY